MISILQHIQYLVLHHDCVVIPGLGAFVARYVGATFSEDCSSIIAPHRELGFNALLSHDDGILIGSVTRRERVSYECARSAVEREVELINRRLRHEGSLMLDRIGTLTLNEHGAIEFSPATESPIFAQPFAGLTSISLQQIVTSEQNDTVDDVQPLILHVDTHSENKKRIRRRALSAIKYAASVVIAFGLGITMLTPISPDKVDKASLSAPIESSKTQELSAADKYANCEINLYIPDEKEATATVPMKTAPDGTVIISNDTYSAPRYYVIVASTTSLKEARRYVKIHSTEKYPLQILPGKGRYRVFVASGNDFDEMSSFRKKDKQFAAANPNAWVYTLPV